MFGYRVHVYRFCQRALEATTLAFVDVPLRRPWVETAHTRGVAALEQSTVAADQAATVAVLPLPLQAPVRTSFPVEAGGSYCFTVQTITGIGSSPESQRSELLLVPAKSLSPCRGLLARLHGLRDVQLSWQPPSYTCPNALTSYEVFCSPVSSSGCQDEGGAETTSQLVPISGCPPTSRFWVRHLVHGLTPGQEYAFCVRAVSALFASTKAHAPWTILIPNAIADSPTLP
eukprot:TRINITY_DN60911_c0_g1_i1.p1 TRINITY_DN60911_c0_g1~~TRINITY_DN60911_c0_g1_i1.p1  ORF type:complete len:268 (+),score=27.25 TRINITY_DN60911_c0_g1_i1:116-805(+)